MIGTHSSSLASSFARGDTFAIAFPSIGLIASGIFKRTCYSPCCVRAQISNFSASRDSSSFADRVACVRLFSVFRSQLSVATRGRVQMVFPCDSIVYTAIIILTARSCVSVICRARLSGKTSRFNYEISVGQKCDDATRSAVK